MIKHTDNVAIAALTQWMLANQDDTGCREAAETLGELGAVSTLLEMLDGPLTARCALEVAAALGNHADASHLPHLYRHYTEFGKVTAMIEIAIEEAEENAGECTCGQCRDVPGGQSGPDGTDRPVGAPDNLPPYLRN